MTGMMMEMTLIEPIEVVTNGWRLNARSLGGSSKSYPGDNSTKENLSSFTSLKSKECKAQNQIYG
jgi:hypothetical protein